MNEPTIIADLSSFATLGAVSTAQELIRAVVTDVDGAEPQIVVEESLALMATATARAVEVGLGAVDYLTAIDGAVLRIPFAYRDYLLGAQVLEGGHASVMQEADAIEARLRRKVEFYGVHLPARQFPPERTLREKMELWMGRVSPPKLPELPTYRLERLQLVPAVRTHMRVVRAYARRLVEGV